MSDDDRTRELDRVRRLILARRNQFMATALAGLGAVGTGCGSGHSSDGPDAGTTAAPDAPGQTDRCIDSPDVCQDASTPTEVEMDAGDDAGTEPRFCLTFE